MPSRWFFIAGIALLVASVYWWGDYYTAFLQATGRMDTTKDWMDAIEIYGQCLFRDTEPCLAARREPALAQRIAYQPFLAWIAFGALAAGAILRIRETWRAAGPQNA